MNTTKQNNNNSVQWPVMATSKKKHNLPRNGLSWPQWRGKTIKTVTFAAYCVCKKKKAASQVAG